MQMIEGVKNLEILRMSFVDGPQGLPRLGDHHHNHTYPLKGQRGKKSKNSNKSKSPLEHSDSYSYKRYTQL